MAVGSVWLLFTVFIVALVYHAQSTEIHVKSSPNEECPTGTQTCVTLQELANNITAYTCNVDENITLEFLPGNHILDSLFTFTNFSGATLVKFADAFSKSEPATIVCFSVTNFAFNDLNSVRVVGLTFIGCTGMRVHSVNQFTLEDSYFDAQNISSGTALKLDRVSASSIFGTKFVSYRGEDVVHLVSFCVSNPYYTTLKIGGTFSVNHSQVNIDNSTVNLIRIKPTLEASSIVSIKVMSQSPTVPSLETKLLSNGSGVSSRATVVVVCCILMVHQISISATVNLEVTEHWSLVELCL